MSVYTIECNYVLPELAAAFLIVEGEEAAFVENNTAKAVPLFLEELKKRNIKKENVKYIIITHVHLDHAGGTAELLKHCPNATVYAHPKAAPHLISPKRLVESATLVYGKEAFEAMYGEIEPVPEDRIKIPTDGEAINWGNRYLKFLYTRGHANHHFVVYDSLSNGIFTGDSFGIGYPITQKGTKPMLFPSTTPTDFDPIQARLSIDKILATGADKAYLTHFGIWEYMKEGATQLKSGLDYMEQVLLGAQEKSLPDSEVESFCENKVRAYIQNLVQERGLDDSVYKYLDLDISINAMGIAFVAKRARKKSS